MPSQLGITQLRGQVAKSDLRRTRMAQLKPTVLRTTNNYGRFAEVMKHPASAGSLTDTALNRVAHWRTQLANSDKKSCKSKVLGGLENR
jgi:hypothetical protein